MSKHKKPKWKKLEEKQNNRIQYLKTMHSISNNTGFNIPKQEVIEEKKEELVLTNTKGLIKDNVTTDSFDLMYKLLVDKYGDLFLDISTLINKFKVEFDFVTTEEEIYRYLDVTLGDDEEDKQIMLNNIDFNVDFD